MTQSWPKVSIHGEQHSGFGPQHVPQLHRIGLGQDALHRPPGELERVVLHLGREDRTTLAGKLGPPVECPTAALGLVVELIERLDRHVLVLAVDVVLDNGIQLRPHNEMQRFFVLVQGQIETTVPVSLGRGRVALVILVVKGMLVWHVNLVGLRLLHNLEWEDVVDVRGFEHEGAGAVDGVFVTLGDLKRCICCVLIDRNHVQVGVVSLVDEDLVVPLDNDQIPRVDRLSGAHQHRENAVCCEDSGFILFGQFLQNGIA